MEQDRRTFLHTLTAAAVSVTLAVEDTPSQTAFQKSKIKAIAFDAFPIFDPRPISALAESLFPNNGAALMNAWRIRQFEYQWLRTMAGQYRDFLHATDESLTFAANQLNLELTAEKRKKLMSAWMQLTVWPDAAEALQKLKSAGYRMIFLSNMTAEMLNVGLREAKLGHLFEAIISTDQIKAYKPETKAYKLGIDRLKLKKEEVLFAAFAGWDVAGAKWFGYPTYWVNRLGSPAEELGVTADFIGKDLKDLTNFLIPS